MRILQLIDTLDAGGAERMAVNYANAIFKNLNYSAIAVTRKEGNLKNELNQGVNYFFLDKKSTFDFKAILKLKEIIKTQKIDFIHAHGTSFFTAILVKILYFKVKIIWHDHYGDSEFLQNRPKIILQLISPFFTGIIAVNNQLLHWSKNILNVKNVIYLPNFTVKQKNVEQVTKLFGSQNNRIVCLANFRLQKNHEMLLDVAITIKKVFPDWTFHFIGKNFEDQYFSDVKNKIVDNNLENHVYIYNNVQDIDYVLSQAAISVLTSNSEGLPLVLLEYGLAKLPVVVTNVGEIGKIIEDNENGFLVASNDTQNFIKKLKVLIQDQYLQRQFGEKLNVVINSKYVENAVMVDYLNFLNSK